MIRLNNLHKSDVVVFRDAGILFPDGFENLQDEEEMAQADDPKTRNPEMRRAVVKLNDGFSGEGNALFYFDNIDATDSVERLKQIRAELPKLRFEAPMEHWDSYREKYRDMGGVVELFVEGKNKLSPSSQCRVNAVGEPVPISTHDQVLGGASGQVFLGCTFPAHPSYRLGTKLRYACRRGTCKTWCNGRFATDFVSIPTENATNTMPLKSIFERWHHASILHTAVFNRWVIRSGHR